MKAVTVDAMAAKLETIAHRSPDDFAAFGHLIDMVLDRLKKQSAVDRGVRGRLLSRLQAVHECRQPLGGQFEQIEPLGKVRQWRCSGCHKIITLSNKP